MEFELYLENEAKIVINAIETSSNKHIKREMVAIGHFSYRVFNIHHMFHQEGGRLAYFFMCMEMAMPPKEYERMEAERRRYRKEVVDSFECDDIIKDFLNNTRKK